MFFAWGGGGGTYQDNGERFVAWVDEYLLGLLEVGDPAVCDQQHDRVLIVPLEHTIEKTFILFYEVKEATTNKVFFLIVEWLICCW